MPNEPKIVIIGAGSASFGLETLTGLIDKKELESASLCLVDINEENLKAVNSLTKITKKEFSADKLEIIASTKREEVLEDADFVILSVAVDREETWIKDIELAKKYGIWHYGENGGPGSFSHTARGLTYIKPILEDIHDLAPNAWLLNYTNPLPRISYAAESLGIKSIGLCHQIWHAYAIVGRYLANPLGITDPNLLNFIFKWNDENFIHQGALSLAAFQEYEVKAAGLNHFIWITEVRSRDNWNNIYPLIRDEAKNVNKEFEPLTQHMFNIFGLLPGPGDTHLTEYVPYTITKENWKKYAIALYDFEWAKKKRDDMWKHIYEINSGEVPHDLFPNPSERADWIIKEIYQNENVYEQSVNIVNNGSISNLPDDAIVEVPALVGGFGVSGMKMGRLPEGIAALCNREISIAKLMTKAAMEGDKEAAIQAFALDTMVNDLSLAETMIEDYLTTHRKYLPQFKE